MSVFSRCVVLLLGCCLGLAGCTPAGPEVEDPKETFVEAFQRAYKTNSPSAGMALYELGPDATEELKEQIEKKLLERFGKTIVKMEVVPPGESYYKEFRRGEHIYRMSMRLANYLKLTYVGDKKADFLPLGYKGGKYWLIQYVPVKRK